MKNVRFMNTDCRVEFGQYAPNGNTAISLFDAETGEPFAKATVNPGPPVPANYVVIKDYSENTGMADALIEAGIIEPEAEAVIPVGHAAAPVHKLIKKDANE